MSVFVATAPMKDDAAGIELSSAISPGAQYGVALDGFAMSFGQHAQSIGVLQARIPAQGLANDNATLRAIMMLQTGNIGSSKWADVSGSALGLTCVPALGANPEITLAFIPNVSGGSSQSYEPPFPSSYAYPGLAGFKVSLPIDSPIASIVYASGLRANGDASGGSISWSPEVSMNGSLGSTWFQVISIPAGSSVPAAQSVRWSPGQAPMVTASFTGLSTPVSAAAILIDNFDFQYSSPNDIHDIALSAGNDNAVVTCTQNGSTYDATVRFVPQMMMRDSSGHQMDNSSSVGFFVLVFPGTPVQTEG